MSATGLWTIAKQHGQMLLRHGSGLVSKSCSLHQHLFPVSDIDSAGGVEHLSALQVVDASCGLVPCRDAAYGSLVLGVAIDGKLIDACGVALLLALHNPVSYTHPTLPTNREVFGVGVCLTLIDNTNGGVDHV